MGTSLERQGDAGEGARVLLAPRQGCVLGRGSPNKGGFVRAPRWALGASRRGRSPCTHTHTGRSVPARPAAWLPFKAEPGFPRSVRTACRHFGSRAVSDTARDLPARSSPGPADGIAAARGRPCPAPSTQHPAPSLFQNAFCSAGGVDLPSPGLDPAALHPGWHKAALQGVAEPPAPFNFLAIFSQLCQFSPNH